MSSIFAVDPVSFTFPATYNARNLVYGPHPDHRLNYYRNATRLAGGNPVYFFMHGGALIGYEKTDQVVNGRVSTWIIRFLLTPGIWDVYGDVPFDVVSIGTPQWGWGLSEAPDYEEQLDDPAITHGTGVQSFAPYGLQFPDDVQRAWQWVFANAAELGCDPARAVAGGYSYGGFASMVAALRESRPWDTTGATCDGAMHEAKVSMILNYSGEISMSPEVIEHTTIRYLFGVSGTDDTYAGAVRDQVNRILLLPKSDGTFDSTCERSPYCKAISPMDLITVARAAKKGIRFRSYYDTDDNTASPILGYPAVPPYNFSGHDYHQLALLNAQLSAYGFTHVAGDTYDGTNIQAALEPTLVDTYTDMIAAVA